MAACPLVFPSPIIARRTVPGGSNLTEELLKPCLVIDSRVVEIILFLTSPELTQWISPFQYSEIFLEGVLPFETVPIAPIGQKAQVGGSSSTSSLLLTLAENPALICSFSLLLDTFVKRASLICF